MREARKNSKCDRRVAGSRAVKEFQSAPGLIYGLAVGLAVIDDSLCPYRVIQDPGALNSEHISSRANRERTRPGLEGNRLYGCV